MNEQPSEFSLPGGLIEEGGRRLVTAELRAVSGREEEWLAVHPGAPSARAVTVLLSACLVRLGGVAPGADLVRRLLVGDRDYLVLQLRRLTLGDRVCAVLRCLSCAANMDIDFRAADIPIERRTQEAEAYTVEAGGRAVRFRLPTGGDQEAVLGLDADAAADALLDRCLLDDSGRPLSAQDRTAVIDAMDRLAPQIDLELELTCPECGHAFVAPFDTTAFFLQELRAGAGRLLREVHLLALYYHWSEADILALGRARRRAYLALLSDTVRAHPS